MRNTPHASCRHRLLITVLGAPAALILLVCLIMPRTSPLEPGFGRAQAWRNASAGGASRYSLVVDAGSTGSRIHIFKFNPGPDGELELEFDKFEQLKPGLSAHADDPAAAAASLKPLLALALETIPKAAQAQTHVLVGATAGLRLLPGDSADRILAAVRALLSDYPFQVRPWAGVGGAWEGGPVCGRQRLLGARQRGRGGDALEPGG